MLYGFDDKVYLKILIDVNNDDNNYIVPAKTRLLQICHPTLCPIYVSIVNESELTDTIRKDKGFGSTDK